MAANPGTPVRGRPVDAVTALTPADVLPPALLARLGRLRLGGRARVHGRFSGAHASRRYGTAIEFAEHRAYVPGDDLRALDVAASRRTGRWLVRLSEAEDEAALRIVVDTSASMGLGEDATPSVAAPASLAARRTAAAVAAIALAGGDRVRVLLAGGAPGPVDAGPWCRGEAGLAVVVDRLARASCPGPGDLVAALQRAAAEGPRGPGVLVTDLLYRTFPRVVRALGANPGDATCLQVVARDVLQPRLHDDARLVDVETLAEVEVSATDAALRAHAERRDRWLGEVRRRCAAVGAGHVLHVAEDDVAELVSVRLPALGLVA